MALSDLSAEERHAAVSRARHFASLMFRREAQEEARRFHAKMYSDLPVQRSSGTAKDILTDRECWLLGVAAALEAAMQHVARQLGAGEVGGRAGDIVIARLTRREKSKEASWDQIGRDYDTAPTLAKALYDEGVQPWLLLLELRGIGLDIAVAAPRFRSEEQAEQSKVRCAAEERAKAQCPIDRGIIEGRAA